MIPNTYNPLDWNRYSYTDYNPVNRTDPTGHCSRDGDDYCYQQPTQTICTSCHTPVAPAFATPTIYSTPTSSCTKIPCNSTSTPYPTTTDTGPKIGGFNSPTPAPTPTAFGQDIVDDPNVKDAVKTLSPSPFPDLTGFDANQAWDTALRVIPPYLGYPAVQIEIQKMIYKGLETIGDVLPSAPATPMLPPILPIFIIPTNLNPLIPPPITG
jgi:hypothetical protein